jgi:hypothetical protein
MDYLDLRWNRYVLSYDLERQLSFIKSVTTRSRQMSFRVERLSRKLSGLFRLNLSWFDRPENARHHRVIVVIAEWTPSALVFVALLASLLLAARRRRGRPMWIYRKLLRGLESTGEKKSDRETLGAFAARLRPKLGARASAADLLLDAYHRRRFGGPAGATPDEEVRLKEALKSLSR